jgi:hypothetical protein
MKVRERFWVFVFVVAGNNLQMKMNEVVSASQLSWKIEKSKTASNKQIAKICRSKKLYPTLSM